MNVTLRQLRAFVEVARSGGFTTAARKLHLTQSATSLLLRELEGQLGVTLLDRTTRQVILTDAGREFLESAERILADVAHAVENAQDLVQKRRGRVTVATSPFLAATFLPNVIARFQEAYPAITLRVVDESTEHVMRTVLSGDADIGFGVFPQLKGELERAVMLRHKLGVMVPAQWAMPKRSRSLSWADLKDKPMIGLVQASGFPALTDPLLLREAGKLNLRFEVGHLGTAVGMVEAGLGATVVPAYVGALMRSTRARFIELKDPVVERDVELVWRAGRSLSPGTAAFQACLVDCCRELQA
ncbi:MAG: LysR substrate-binding domain-containing protein [Pseudomonadota bacterium]